MPKIIGNIVGSLTPVIKNDDVQRWNLASNIVLKDFPNSVKMKNTDKLCVFTAEGNMYQVKASAIPKGRPKDKGVTRM